MSSKRLYEETKQEIALSQGMKNWTELLIWARWMPDLYLDLITPKKNGIKLDFDQRIFLRVMFRFMRDYIVFPRG